MNKALTGSRAHTSWCRDCMFAIVTASHMMVVRDAVKAGGQDTRWHDTGQPPISWHACCRWVSVYSTAASALLQSASFLPASCKPALGSTQVCLLCPPAIQQDPSSACSAAGSRRHPVPRGVGLQRTAVEHGTTSAGRCVPDVPLCVSSRWARHSVRLRCSLR
jgi:hypothetical protein